MSTTSTHDPNSPIPAPSGQVVVYDPPFGHVPDPVTVRTPPQPGPPKEFTPPAQVDMGPRRARKVVKIVTLVVALGWIGIIALTMMMQAEWITAAARTSGYPAWVHLLVFFLSGTLYAWCALALYGLFRLAERFIDPVRRAHRVRKMREQHRKDRAAYEQYLDDLARLDAHKSELATARAVRCP